MELRFIVSVWLCSVGYMTTAAASAPELTWQAPAACPDVARVRAAIVRTIDETDAELGRASVRARVQQVAGGYQLDLTLRTGAALTERRLHAARCETFVDVIALELGAAATVAPPRPTAAPAWPEELGLGARLATSLGSGPTPALAPRVSLSGLLRVRQLQLELGASYDLPRERRYIGLASVGARFTLFAGQARGCWAARLGDLELPLCAGLEAGALRGEGLGLPVSERATRRWLALSVSSGLRYPRASRVSLYLEVAGLVGLVQPTFGVTNLPPLYRPDRLLVRGVAGLELHFD